MSAETIKAVSQLVAAVTWPILIFTILVTQRAVLSEVLRRVRSIHVPGVALDLFDAVTEAAQQIEQVDPDAAKRVTEQQFDAAARVARMVSNADISVVRRSVQELAGEYEATRASLPSGNERTGRMETVVTKMRTLGRAALSLLPELIRSPSPGERLAAIAILQLSPRPDYLSWLAERFRNEKPFVQFHAAVALLSAVRVLDNRHASDLKNAISSAKQAINAQKGSDRWNTLEEAERELSPQFA